MKLEKCYVCEKGRMKAKKVDFSMYGVSLGKFDAKVCSLCGEKFFNEKTSSDIDKSAKESGLWCLEADTKIAKSGSSIAVTINKKIVDFMNLRKGKEVHLVPKDKNSLLIEVC